MAAASIYPLPLGCPFQPDDRDLLHFLLLKKASLQHNQNHVPAYLPISHRELYHQEPPSQIFSGHLAPELYFFTTFKKKFENGNSCRRDREVGGNGYWKSQHTKELFDDQGCLLGCMTALNFFETRDSKKSDWIMHEYTLPDTSFNWAICRIKRAPHAFKSKSRAAASSLSSTAGVKRKAPPAHDTASTPALVDDFCYTGFDDDDIFFNPDELLGTFDGSIDPPVEDTPTPPPGVSFLDGDPSLPSLVNNELVGVDDSGTMLWEDSGSALPVGGCADGDEWLMQSYMCNILPPQPLATHVDDSLMQPYVCDDPCWNVGGTSGESLVVPEPVNSTAVHVGVETAKTSARMVVSSSRPKKQRPRLDDPEFRSLFI